MFSNDKTKIPREPRPLSPTFDPTSQTNRATERKRRILTPLAHKAKRIANVFTVPSLRRQALQWVLTRLSGGR